MFFLIKYSKALEEGSFRGKSADFFWMLLFGKRLGFTSQGLRRREVLNPRGRPERCTSAIAAIVQYHTTLQLTITGCMLHSAQTHLCGIVAISDRPVQPAAQGDVCKLARFVY